MATLLLSFALVMCAYLLTFFANHSRYHGNEYEILDYVQSNPVCVLSHSTQLRPVSSMTPSVTEVPAHFSPFF
jgi:hypothetical protein